MIIIVLGLMTIFCLVDVIYWTHEFSYTGKLPVKILGDGNLLNDQSIWKRICVIALILATILYNMTSWMIFVFGITFPFIVYTISKEYLEFLDKVQKENIATTKVMLTLFSD